MALVVASAAAACGSSEGTAEPTAGRAEPAGEWQLGSAAPGEPVPATAVCTGSAVLLWGGQEHVAGATVATAVAGDLPTFHDVAGGWAYDPAADEWTPIPESPTGPLREPSAVWTGTEMVVWGVVPDSLGPGTTRSAGARYDPATGTWRAMADQDDVAYGIAVWTGHELAVVGSGRDVEHGRVAAAWDPSTDTWRPLPEPPVRNVPRPSFGLFTWTGTDVLVVPDFGTGARLDPTADGWQPIAPSPLGERAGSRFFWTGREVLQLGGGVSVGDVGTEEPGSAAYDPATDTWRPIADVSRGAPGLPIAVAGSGLWLLDQTDEGSLRFDDDAGTWDAVDSPPLLPTLAVDAGGRIVAFGPPGPIGADGGVGPFRPARLG